MNWMSMLASFIQLNFTSRDDRLLWIVSQNDKRDIAVKYLWQRNYKVISWNKRMATMEGLWIADEEYESEKYSHK